MSVELTNVTLAANDMAREIERLKDEVGRLLDQQAKDDAEFAQVLLERDRYRSAWQSARERAQAYGEGILRITGDRESYQGWLKQEQAATQQLRARIADLERPAIEAKRGEITQSYRELAAQAREDRDYEGEAHALHALAAREAQWACEDAQRTAS